MTLDPHTDWRDLADALRDLPRCKHCGEPAGNVAFGAAHYTGPGYAYRTEDGMRVVFLGCPGYEPETESAR